MAINLSTEKKVGLFLLLASTPLYDVGLKYGFDKYYKDTKAIKGAVYRHYAEVKNNPEKFGISKDTYDLVLDAMAARAITPHKPRQKAIGKKELAQADIKKLVLNNRDTLARLMARKLDMISNAELKKMSLKDFGTLFGILFDKGQIIQGQATEHVAHLSKIEDGLSSKELLDAVINQREHTVTNKK